MGLSSTIGYGATVATDTMKWAWSWGQKPIKTAGQYVGDTLAYAVKGVGALWKSVPALVTPQQRKLLKAAGYITTYRILPLVALHAANSFMQTMMPKQAQTKEEQETNYYLPLMYATAIADVGVSLYSLRNNKGAPASKMAQTVSIAAKSVTYLTAYAGMPLITTIGAAPSFPTVISSAGSIMNAGVYIYTYWQMSEALAHRFVIDMAAPAALTSHKTLHSQHCEKEKCNFKRKIKGDARQTFIFLLNNGIAFSISFIPYVGVPLSIGYGVLAHGSQITRLSRSNLCERHAGEVDSPIMLATGGTYAALTMAIDSLLKSTMGVPPLLAIHHFVFLFLINNTAHMEIDQVPFGGGRLSIDPIVGTEKILSILIDTFLAGSMSMLTKLFHPTPDKPPIIPLSRVLKELTVLLNSDLEKIRPTPPTFFQKAKNTVLPPMFRSTKDFVRDDVVRIFWNGQQESLLFIVGIIESIGIPIKNLMNSSIPLLGKAVKKSLPEVLYQKYGISVKFTSPVLKMAKEDEFWELERALKGWLRRHNVDAIIPLAPTPAEILNVGLLEAPAKPQAAPEKSSPPALESATPPTPKTPKPEVKASVVVTPIGKEDSEKNGTSVLDPRIFAFARQKSTTPVTLFRPSESGAGNRPSVSIQHSGI